MAETPEIAQTSDAAPDVPSALEVEGLAPDVHVAADHVAPDHVAPEAASIEPAADAASDPLASETPPSEDPAVPFVTPPAAESILFQDAPSPAPQPAEAPAVAEAPAPPEVAAPIPGAHAAPVEPAPAAEAAPAAGAALAAPVGDSGSGGIAASLDVPPLESVAAGEGGEFDLLLGKVTSWLEQADLPSRWDSLEGPLRGLALLIAVVVVLRLYSALLETLGDLPLIPRLLQLVGLIVVVRFGLTRLVRSSDRQQILAVWKERWNDFRGRD